MVPCEVLTGLTGLAYRFSVVDPSAGWRAVPGLYAFCLPRREIFGPIVPIYVGETSSFPTRMPGHPEWEAAKRLGATVMLAMEFRGTEWQRKEAECDLIRAYRPKLNVQHNTPNALAGLAGIRSGRF